MRCVTLCALVTVSSCVKITNMYNPKKKAAEFTYKVYFSHTDAAGVVHHSNYINWLEAARIDFLDHIHYPYHTLQAEKKGFSPIHIDIHYDKALRFADTFSIRIHCDAITRASVSFYSEFICNNSVICRATQKLASLDEQLWKVTKVPEGFLQQLEAFESS